MNGESPESKLSSMLNTDQIMTNAAAAAASNQANVALNLSAALGINQGSGVGATATTPNVQSGT